MGPIIVLETHWIEYVLKHAYVNEKGVTIKEGKTKVCKTLEEAKLQVNHPNVLSWKSHMRKLELSYDDIWFKFIDMNKFM